MKTGLVFAIIFASATGVAIPLCLRQPAGSHQAEEPAVSKPETRTVAIGNAKEQPEVHVASLEPSIGANADRSSIATSAKRTTSESPAYKRTKLSGDEIYAKALSSTVWITNPGLGFGSGVLIDAKDKLVVTNYHVVFQSNVYQDHTVVLNNNSILTPFDNPNELRVPFVVYNLTLSRGVQYVFELTSPAFDPLLSIHNFRSQLLAFDKAGGGRMNARLNFVAPYDGKYQLMVATCNGGVGAFTVKGFRLSARIHGASVAPFLLVSFPATENGRVITDANHYLMVNSTNQERHKAKVVAWNEAKDLAILKLNYLPEDVKPMPLARESSQPGHLVHSIGNPGKSGALWVYSSGTVRTAPYQKQWQTSGPGGTMSHDAWIIETQSPINFGDSGGPLVSEDLELVGITQGFNSVSNSISLFVDVREVRSLLRSHGFGWVERK